jgi:hypothetical protein
MPLCWGWTAFFGERNCAELKNFPVLLEKHSQWAFNPFSFYCPLIIPDCLYLKYNLFSFSHE